MYIVEKIKNSYIEWVGDPNKGRKWLPYGWHKRCFDILVDRKWEAKRKLNKKYIT